VTPVGNRLIVATRNPEKLIELRRILEAGRVPVDVGDLGEFPDLPEIAETGLPFTENALLKARAVAAFTGLPAVADDSGLCVDALNGMPGVLSARWSGPAKDNHANNLLLLGQLEDVPDERRGAEFVAAVAFCRPGAEDEIVRGEMRGSVIRELRGSGGFGYDVLFQADGYDRTTAELSIEEKDAISHRGKALRALAPIVAEALGA